MTRLVNQLVTGLVDQLVTEQPVIYRSTTIIVAGALKISTVVLFPKYQTTNKVDQLPRSMVGSSGR